MSEKSLYYQKNTAVVQDETKISNTYDQIVDTTDEAVYGIDGVQSLILSLHNMIGMCETIKMHPDTFADLVMCREQLSSAATMITTCIDTIDTWVNQNSDLREL